MSFKSTVEHTHGSTLRAGSVRITRQVNAPAERVFDAWLRAEEAWAFLEIDRPHRLVFSLFAERYGQRDDRVVVEVAPLERQSLVVLTHEYSSPSQAERARIQGEWTTFLDRLTGSCSESAGPGIALPWFPAPMPAPSDADFVWPTRNGLT